METSNFMETSSSLVWFLPVTRATVESFDKPKSKDSIQGIETAQIATTMKKKQIYNFILLLLSGLKAWHRLCFLHEKWHLLPSSFLHQWTSMLVSLNILSLVTPFVTVIM